jgi:hypothetical protein
MKHLMKIRKLSCRAGSRFAGKIGKLILLLRRNRKRTIAAGLAIILFLSPMVYLNLREPKEAKADTFFKFDEGYGTSVNDLNGSVSAGTITGATWQTENLCFDEKCLYFDGTGDFVSVSDDADLDFAAADNFTIELWFRHGSVSATEVMIAKYIAGEGGTDGGYKILMESDGDITFAIDDDETWTPDDNVTTTTADFDNNSWHHIAAVKDGTTGIYLYIDGQFKGSDETIAATNTLENDDAFYVGIDGDGSSNDFTGFIDEVKVYASARTADEIKADFLGTTISRGKSASFEDTDSWLSDGLVGYWDFEEATGSATVDRSGNGNTGTLTNMQETGIADGNSTDTTIVDTDGSLSATDDVYNGMIAEITGGGSCAAVAGEQRTISDYTGASNTVTVGTAFSDVADNCGYIIKHQVGGKFGRALGFDETNDYVDTNLTIGDGYTELSVFTWANIVTTNTTRGIIMRDDWGGGANDVYALSLYGPGNVLRGLVVDSDGNPTDSYTDITTGWHHIGFTFDGPTKKFTLYLDGEIIITSNTSTGTLRSDIKK